MATVTGTIEWKGPNKFSNGGESIKVNGKFYNSGYPIKAEKGDAVQFDDGGKNYVKKLRLDNSSTSSPEQLKQPQKIQLKYDRHTGQFPVPPDHPDRSIIRQNALTNAREVLMVVYTSFTSAVEMADSIIDLARQFERYTAGDIEMEEATRLFNSEAD